MNRANQENATGAGTVRRPRDSSIRMDTLWWSRTEETGLRSYEEFFASEYGRLFRVLLLMTRSRSEAEDLAQETMARVFERWSRVASLERPDAYAFKVALNLNRRRMREVSRARERERVQVLLGDDERESLEQRLDVRAAIETLPRDQRAVLLLVDWLGFDSPTASSILGIKPSTLRTRLHRARNAIKRLLGDRDD